jgi:deazaflavin-dependent oxidoreductase (nitroreductase family)
VTEDIASEPFCYLTTAGRTSGRPHRIEIWFALHEGTVYLLSGGRDKADWVRNIQASPLVELELSGKRRTTSARVIDPASHEDGLARELLLMKYQPGSSEDLTSWSRTALPVAVDWGD